MRKLRTRGHFLLVVTKLVVGTAARGTLTPSGLFGPHSPGLRWRSKKKRKSNRESKMPVTLSMQRISFSAPVLPVYFFLTSFLFFFFWSRLTVLDFPFLPPSLSISLSFFLSLYLPFCLFLKSSHGPG